MDEAAKTSREAVTLNYIDNLASNLRETGRGGERAATACGISAVLLLALTFGFIDDANDLALVLGDKIKLPQWAFIAALSGSLYLSYLRMGAAVVHEAVLEGRILALYASLGFTEAGQDGTAWHQSPLRYASYPFVANFRFGPRRMWQPNLWLVLIPASIIVMAPVLTQVIAMVRMLQIAEATWLALIAYIGMVVTMVWYAILALSARFVGLDTES